MKWGSSDGRTVFCFINSLLLYCLRCHHWRCYHRQCRYFLNWWRPLSAIARIAQSLKIWAVVCAIGGTFDAIETFQKGLLAGSTIDLFTQFMLIISAMIGVRTALLFIGWIVNEELS